jgi:hypothetical protein
MEAWRAESLVLEGRWPDALVLADRLLAGAGGSSDGVAPLLHRLRGYALARTGRDGPARAAVDESLRLAEAAGSDYERALAWVAMSDLWPGSDDAGAAKAESAPILERLGVVVVPRPPAR